MLSRVYSGAVLGIDAYVVRVETDVSNGLPTFSTVGLAQGAVREGEKRVIAAVKNSGFDLPPKRITINLAPADIRKEGSAFDLPIAVGILVSTGQIPEGRLRRHLLLGELGLDGTLRPVRGVLPVAVIARERGLRGLILPHANLAEAAVVEGLEVLGAKNLREIGEFLLGRHQLRSAAAPVSPTEREDPPPAVDLIDVRGQEHAKRALEIAAAGGHNILMVGAPGSGKTMLARRLPGILPQMEAAESLETTKIHSVAGLLRDGIALIRTRPFRAPHHTVSFAGLIGGGSTPRPGEVSLAHNGVLFLDELPEFRRNVLEVLRQPLEDNEVSIARAGVSLTYPARFMLVAAMNPCPCGFSGDSIRACTCPPSTVQRYLSRVSGPLLDRIDIHVELPSLPSTELSERKSSEDSAAVRVRVTSSRFLQRERFAGRSGVHANAHMTPRELREHCRLDARGEAVLKAAMTRLGLSARAYFRVLRIARTIADMEGSGGIGSKHVAEAVQYRSLDRIRS